MPFISPDEPSCSSSLHRAAGVVDVCLIPEVEFNLDALVKHLSGILERKGHCVVCVAEGAGQDLLEKHSEDKTDLSGNPILEDVGRFLRRNFKQKIKVPISAPLRLPD